MKAARLPLFSIQNCPVLPPGPASRAACTLAVALWLTVLAGACGLPSKQIALAYVTADKVPVHVEPRRGSPVLATFKRNDKLVIVKDRIKDKELGEMTYWYGVKLPDGKDAFLSYDEQLVRSNITTVVPSEKPVWGLVLADTLNMRGAPSITAPVVGTLKRNAVLAVSGRGTTIQKIGDQEGYWLEVEHAKGRSYVFDNFIETGTKEALQKLAQGDYRRLAGWVRLKEDVTIVDSLDKDSKPAVVTDHCDSKSLKLPRRGDYAAVSVSLKHENKLYYKVEDRSQDFECVVELVGWVPASAVEFFPDFFAHSSKEAKSQLNPDLLRELNRAVGGNLNVFTLKIKTVELARAPETKDETVSAKAASAPTPAPAVGGGETQPGAAPLPTQAACATLYLDPKAQEEAEGKSPVCRRYLQVQAHTGHRGLDKVLFVLRDQGTFSTVGVFEAQDIPVADAMPDSGSIMRDFDGDGNMEIVTTVSNRGGASQTFFALQGNRYVKVYEHTSSTSGGLYSQIAMSGPYLAVKVGPDTPEDALAREAPFSKRFNKRRERVLKFEKGRFVEVDAKTSGLDFKKLFSS